MDEKSTAIVPLLVSEENGLKKPSFLRSSTLLFLKFHIWVIFIAWVAFIFLYPLEFMNELNGRWNQATRGTIFGVTGSVFLIYSGPIMLITFLAIAHLIISGKEEIHKKKKKTNGPRLDMWTFPVLIDGPFGVVSGAELIGIVLFSVYTIWAISAFTVRNYHLLPLFHHLPSKYKSALMLELTGLRFGYIGLICLGFLFLPVARGSVLLRYMHIPFEQATRYHVWLGHLTMLLFTLHGVFYMIGWTMEGRLIEEIIAWKNTGIANLPGVISLLAGLIMWMTSMPGVRRINFELFFYTHQFYVIFIVFLAMHVGDFIFSIAAGGIFIFMLDRFLRFFQSRKQVDILHARCFPNGIVELVLSKPAGLHYNALGWIFLQIRELSFLQWHPFSVSSSPLDGKYHISVLIKVLGGWTEKLKDQVLCISGEQSEMKPLLLQQNHPKISAFIEGPYGHESPYHLMYENLILVAGGIGISPFLAILRDIVHRINDGKPCLNKNVLIIWAVKKSDELPLLHTLDLESIFPSFSDLINLEIQIYVTREPEPPLEEGKIDQQSYFSICPQSSKCSTMSVLVGTGNIIWSGIYVIVSTLGLVISVGLMNTFYINPFNIHSWWCKGLLFLASMAASVLVFGGLVIGLWHLCERKTSMEDEIKNDEKKIDIVQESSCQEHYISSIRYAQRPDFEDIFSKVSERWGSVDIGVIVCGPYALMSSVARECRTMNLKRKQNHPIFHFNSHSFDL